MKRGLIVLLLAVILIGVGIIELNATNKITDHLTTEITQITSLLHEQKENISSLEPEVEHLIKVWDEKEFYLGLMFNKSTYSNITENLNTLHSHVTLNEYNEAYTNLNLLKLLLEENKNFLSFTFENVF